jgi:hypothetical protein
VVERTPCPATAAARKPRPRSRLSPYPQKPVPRNKNIHVREKRGRKKALTGENCAICAAVETERRASPSRTRLQPPALSVRSSAAALSLSQEKSRGCYVLARLFSGGWRSWIVSGQWESRKGREWIGFLSGLA